MSMRCVQCDQPAVYVYSGFSYCGTCFDIQKAKWKKLIGKGPQNPVIATKEKTK